MGPYDQWPLGRGFERYYGFLDAVTDQFEPTLVQDNQSVPAPRRPEQGYTLNEDLVDHAIAFVTDQVSLAPDKPFFLYFAAGATHSPHQAPPAWLAKYRGRYDEGWDVIRARRLARQKVLGIVPPDTELTPRNAGVVAWEDLDADERRLYARFQEAFAAFLDHTDHQLGRLIDHLERLGQIDNTLFILLSDNGASQEGQVARLDQHDVLRERRRGDARVQPCAHRRHRDAARAQQLPDRLGAGGQHAAQALQAEHPRRRHRRSADRELAGRNRRARRARRSSTASIDVAPTVLECVGIAPPATLRGVPQMPIHGISMRTTFAADGAEPAAHAVLRDVRPSRDLHDGWKAVAWHKRYSSYDDDVWELYHVDADVAENHDLATREPERLHALIALWWEEAERYDVLPLDDRGFAERRAASKSRRDSPRTRSEYVYHGGVGHVAAGAVPFTLDRSYSITAHVTLDPGDEGVIIACGGVCGGYSLYVKDGAIVHDYNYYQTIYRAAGAMPRTGGAAARSRMHSRSPGRSRGGAASPSTGRKWPASRCRRLTAISWTGKASTSGATPARPRHPPTLRAGSSLRRADRPGRDPAWRRCRRRGRPRADRLTGRRHHDTSRSGVAEMLWIARSAPLNSCSGSSRTPTVSLERAVDERAAGERNRDAERRARGLRREATRRPCRPARSRRRCPRPGRPTCRTGRAAATRRARRRSSSGSASR